MTATTLPSPRAAASQTALARTAAAAAATVRVTWALTLPPRHLLRVERPAHVPQSEATRLLQLRQQRRQRRQQLQLGQQRHQALLPRVLRDSGKGHGQPKRWLDDVWCDSSSANSSTHHATAVQQQAAGRAVLVLVVEDEHEQALQQLLQAVRVVARRTRMAVSFSRG